MSSTSFAMSAVWLETCTATRCVLRRSVRNSFKSCRNPLNSSINSRNPNSGSDFVSFTSLAFPFPLSAATFLFFEGPASDSSPGTRHLTFKALHEWQALVREDASGQRHFFSLFQHSPQILPAFVLHTMFPSNI